MPELVAIANVHGAVSVWYVSTLLDLVKNLPVRAVPVDSFRDLDENLWFSIFGEVPTCRAVATHARRILETDLSYPVILSPAGEVLDGMHRVAKAWLAGHKEVLVVQIPHMPPPDAVLPPNRAGRISELMASFADSRVAGVTD
jgi:hypothetical protein